MKIDKSIQSVATISVNDGKKRTDIITNPSASQENNVHFSPNIAKLHNISGSSATDTIVDTARVQEIKQAISEGNFKINPEAIADRLLETVKELIQSKKDNV